MDKKFVKSLIQQAIWHMYNESGDKSYKQLFDKWSENIDKIVIRGLENEVNSNMEDKRVIEMELSKEAAFKPFINYIKDKDIRDYMYMGRVQRGDTTIYMYKNKIDRTYINVDEKGEIYSFNSQDRKYMKV